MLPSDAVVSLLHPLQSRDSFQVYSWQIWDATDAGKAEADDLKDGLASSMKRAQLTDSELPNEGLGTNF